MPSVMNTGTPATSNQVSFAGGTLELRSDSNQIYWNNMIRLGGGAINLGQAPGGTGTRASDPPASPSP